MRGWVEITAIGKGVIRGAAVRFVPSGGEFIAETQRKREIRRHANHVFGVDRAKQRAPVHLGRRGIVQKARSRSRQKGRAGW